MENKIIAVRFKKTGKMQYFDPLKYKFSINDSVIAKTERGEEIGRVVKILDKDSLSNKIEINKILRPASKKDFEELKKREIKAKEVADFCRKEAKRLKLDMKILAAEYILDGTKLTVYFSAEDRIDFRELVKSLASKYKIWEASARFCGNVCRFAKYSCEKACNCQRNLLEYYCCNFDKPVKGGADSWQNVMFVARILLSVSRFLILTDVRTELGSPTFVA